MNIPDAEHTLLNSPLIACMKMIKDKWRLVKIYDMISFVQFEYKFHCYFKLNLDLECKLKIICLFSDRDNNMMDPTV